MIIKDINEFSKLFKVSIPVASKQRYYLDTLSKSLEFEWLESVVDKFCKWEEELKKENVHVGKAKFKASEILISKLKETEAFQKINAQNKIDDVSFLDERKNNIGRNQISIDLRSANYNLFRSFDKSLPETWKEYCSLNEIPDILSESKSFRQIIFGNLNPKKTQKLMALKIKEVLESLKYIDWLSGKLTYLNSDEIILSFDKDKDEFAFVEHLYKIEEDLNKIAPIRITRFYQTKISNTEFAYKEIFDADNKLKYIKLVSVPGNQFYRYFKQFVLKEQIQEEDLFFIQDGQLAKWVM